MSVLNSLDFINYAFNLCSKISMFSPVRPLIIVFALYIGSVCNTAFAISSFVMYLESLSINSLFMVVYSFYLMVKIKAPLKNSRA